MINLNMEGTIEKSLTSILDQIDERFEVIVCDGGSNDGSISLLRKLQSSYKSLRVVELKKNSTRKKGLDRNISVQHAGGKYVLLHLDCDDVYGNHILDWVTCFHKIEATTYKDCLVSGRHINMLTKKLFTEIGGYKNIEFEDRDLWMRLASVNRLIVWDHIDFVERQKRTLKQKVYKNTIEAYYAVRSDLTQGLTFTNLFSHYLKILKTRFNKTVLTKLLLLPFVSINVLVTPKFEKSHRFDPITFSGYLSQNRKWLDELIDLDRNQASLDFRNMLSYSIFFKKNNS